MGQTKSLAGNDAIEKIKELAGNKMCLFCTHENGKIVSRPMSTQHVEDDGTIWFFSKEDSGKNKQINMNDDVYLMYIDTGKEHYLSLSGHAQVVKDKRKTDELWNGFIKAWFEEGKDDPNLTLIKVTPEEGHYWDTKNGKLVSMLKIATAVFTGSHSDGGVEGDITV